jgi:hypothetical protein
MSDQVLKIDENNVIRFWGSVTVMHEFAIPLGMTSCHTYFSKENQVQTCMHARIKFHAFSDI